VQKSIEAEVVHCPNCNENVPKTLYCLNCGYPLYKLDQEEEDEEALAEQEEAEETELLEAPAEQVVEAEAEPEPVPIEEEPAEAAEPVEFEVVQVNPEPEPFEPEEVIEEVGTLEASEDTPIVLEGPTPEAVPVEETPATVDEVEPKIEEEEETVEPVKMKKVEEMKAPVKFTPDPLTKQVIDNLTKNIMLKARLVKLLEEGAVKERTFKKLFEAYAAEGDKWVRRRDELIESLESDFEHVENSLAESKMILEEFEIRRAIGDVSDKEYSIKAPAYRWDIDALEAKLEERTGSLSYLKNLDKILPSEDIGNLRKMAEDDFRQFEALAESGAVTPDTVVKIRDNIKQVLSSLGLS
jgi:hypothetical protein